MPIFALWLWRGFSQLPIARKVLSRKKRKSCDCLIAIFTRSSTLTELTPYALGELVKAIYVETPDKSGGKRRQKVHIEYDLLGYIPVNELLKAEQA